MPEHDRHAGFVDTHRHMWQGLLRNIGPDDLLLDYLLKILYGHALKMKPDDVYIGDLVTALSAMKRPASRRSSTGRHIATRRAYDAGDPPLRDAKIRAVYGYGPSFGANPPGMRNPNTRTRMTFAGCVSSTFVVRSAPDAGPRGGRSRFATSNAAVREWNIARRSARASAATWAWAKAASSGSWRSSPSESGSASDTTYIHACTPQQRRAGSGTPAPAEPLGSPSRSRLQMGHGMPPIQRRSIVGSVPAQRRRRNEPPRHVHADARVFCAQRVLKNEAAPVPSPMTKAILNAHRRRC